LSASALAGPAAAGALGGLAGGGLVRALPGKQGDAGSVIGGLGGGAAAGAATGTYIFPCYRRCSWSG
jgi:hypothetical protein